MTRSKTPQPTTTVPAHPTFLECDLESWTGARRARAGRRDALLGRVEWLRLTPDGDGLEGRVRDHRSSPYQVRVRCSDERLESECTCPEGASSGCKHAVAALVALRFPLAAAPKPGDGRGRRGARRGAAAPANAMAGFVVLGGGDRTLTRDERIRLATDEERSLRAQRSRRGFRVAWAGEEGLPPRFTVVDRHDREHSVCLRGPRAERPSCTCDDFADAEVGTCVHVERARRWYLRKPKQIPTDLCSVWFSPRVWIDRMPQPFEEIRVDLPDGTRAPELQERLDAEGWLLPTPEGREAADWLQETIDTAGDAARRLGLRLDVDPLVRERFLGRSRRGFERPDASRIANVWNDVVPRLALTLHPYQEEGARFLASRGRAFLADDMGLGKTVQSIAAALLLRKSERAERAVVVCPASLKHQWAQEIDKVCGERATVVEGPSAARQATYRDWRRGFLILNYELLLRDLDALRAVEPDLVVLDEAQRIKNQGTKTARAVKRLESRWAFVLTGTPLENRLLELHSLVEFLHVRALGPRWRLRPFHIVEDAQGRVLAYEGLEVLRRRLRGFFLRRDRAEVLDQLPERTDHTFWIGMSSAQRRPYKRQASRVATLLSHGGALTSGDVQRLLRALTRMRMLCNARAQDDWELWDARLRDPRPWTAEERRALGSPKLEEFVHVLGDLLDESEVKIVVFSQWERMLRLAERFTRETLERRGLRAEIFHGGLRTQTRSELLDGFRLDPDFRVLYSTDAGGLGLNLQDAASIVVNLEVPWNPAVLEQRVGRVHRMGQRRSVRVLHFVTRNAIEEKVRQVVEDKRALFEGVLTEGVDHVVFDEAARSSLVQRVGRLIAPDA